MKIRPIIKKIQKSLLNSPEKWKITLNDYNVYLTLGTGPKQISIHADKRLESLALYAGRLLCLSEDEQNLLKPLTKSLVVPEIKKQYIKEQQARAKEKKKLFRDINNILDSNE